MQAYADLISTVSPALHMNLQRVDQRVDLITHAICFVLAQCVQAQNHLQAVDDMLCVKVRVLQPLLKRLDKELHCFSMVRTCSRTKASGQGFSSSCCIASRLCSVMSRCSRCLVHGNCACWQWVASAAFAHKQHQHTPMCMLLHVSACTAKD